MFIASTILGILLFIEVIIASIFFFKHKCFGFKTSTKALLIITIIAELILATSMLLFGLTHL